MKLKQAMSLKSTDKILNTKFEITCETTPSITSSIPVTGTLIIGAGAAGLMCAANLSTGGIMLEGSSRIGTKLLMSGHGHCNITHAGSIKDFPSCYGEAGRSIRKILYKYSNADLIDFLASRGVNTVTSEDDRIFPESMRAQDVRDAFLEAAESNGFKIITNRKVVEIHLSEASSEVRKYIVVAEAPDGQRFHYEATNLVIATGGKSYPRSGSDGSMFFVLSAGLGIEHTELKPSLAPLEIKGYPYGDLSGISFEKVEVSIYPKKGKRLALLSGSLLLAHENFSGPAILNSSKYAESGCWLQINYIGMSREDALSRIAANHGKTAQSGELASIIAKEFALPRRFAKEVAKRSACSARKAAVLLSEDRFEIESRGDDGLAEVTAGGLRLDQFDCKSMQLKSAPNVYCIGEVLDVDGITGGYNLQFAWSSARAAASSIESNSDFAASIDKL